MVTFAFFLVAVAHTILPILGTPFFLIGDLFVGITGAFNGESKDAVAGEMFAGYHWNQVAESWKKVWE